MSRNRPALATRLAQALRFVDETTGAVIPPIQTASTYARDADYQIRQPYWYKRDGNPTTEWAEAIIADLEEAQASLLFASGMSAASAVIDHLPTGAHVVVPDVIYFGVLQQFQIAAAKGRIEVSFFTPTDPASLEHALRPGETHLVWIETPNNPDWTVTDIAATAKLAHAAGAKLVTDCTATPPCATRALDFGADISFHSATKYLGGHSDLTAGVLSTRNPDAAWEEIALIRKNTGTVLQSFDAFLLIRGMRTLLLRYERQTANALAFAQHFEHHPKVQSVLYPGLPSHKGHDIAKAQTAGLFGGMLSVIVKGGEAAALRAIKAVEIFYPATSLGGVESLIEHRKTVSGPDFPVDQALLRLSIGIEDVNDLIADFEAALNAI